MMWAPAAPQERETTAHTPEVAKNLLSFKATKKNSADDASLQTN